MTGINVVELVVRIQGRLARHSDAELADAIAVISEQSRQLERLQALIGKYPKTKDGVPVCWHENVYHPDEAVPGLFIGHSAAWMHRYLPVSECYSTREAAEKARET